MTTTSPNYSFHRLMPIVLIVAGLLWLGVAVYNVWRGGSFNWGALTAFILIVAGHTIAGSRRRPAER